MFKKEFKSAPLPFMGQKRRFVKEFKVALANYPADAVYVDMFGGSGLLAHTVKNHYPNATVVYNDFDNYAERLANVESTNALIAKLRAIVKDCPVDKKIIEPVRSEILQVVKEADAAGFVDYITLSSSLLFSMKYVLNFAQLEKETLYNTMRTTEYDATGYLDGLNVISVDYKQLFAQYKDTANVVFLVDPPYLSTDVSTYKNYWRLKDYLDVLEVLQTNKYFYFTSNKSNIIELCEWISTKTDFHPFKDATASYTNNQVNYSSSYTDIMLYKYN